MPESRYGMFAPDVPDKLMVKVEALLDEVAELGYRYTLRRATSRNIVTRGDVRDLRKHRLVLTIEYSPE